MRSTTTINPIKIDLSGDRPPFLAERTGMYSATVLMLSSRHLHRRAGCAPTAGIPGSDDEEQQEGLGCGSAIIKEFSRRSVVEQAEVLGRSARPAQRKSL